MAKRANRESASGRRLLAYGREFLDPGRNLVRPFRKHPSRWSWKPADPDAIARPADLGSPEAVTNYRPGPRRQRIALLLGGDHDNASGRILDGLRRLRAKFFKLNWEYLARRGRLTLAVGKGARSLLRVGSLSVDLRDAAAVHFHGTLRFADYDCGWSADEFLKNRRWMAALRDLHAFTRDAVWLPAIPSLCGGETAQHKLWELELARRCGLAVPETICTNSVSEARSFLMRGPAVFRDFSARHVRARGRPCYFRVALADPRSRALGRLPHSPCVFQRYVNKECDVRAVLVGRRVLACRIDSQASERTAMDWRLYDWERVAFEKTTLPPTVSGGLRRLAGRLGLGLASFDLAKGRDGKHYFLEANRPGVYLWLKEFAGIDVCREIARLLASALRR